VTACYTNLMDATTYDLGMVGLGVMGRNLLLNLADHGFRVAGLDTNPDKVKALGDEDAGKMTAGTTDAAAFVRSLKVPRSLIVLVPAGKAVDAVLGELAPRLGPGDLILDAGNSHFKDTERRAGEMAAKSLHFAGMGVSGGEKGARHGPCLMPGGPRDTYQRIKPLLQAVAANVDGEPCVTWCGPRAAGHYVKMVHNGIEYGVMQLLAEAYDLMHRGLGMTNPEMQQVFETWNRGPLQSYLIEITALILGKRDDKTGQYLTDVIRDAARQKGTGKWTSQEAMDLQTPLLTIDAAVAMRDMSALDEQRSKAARIHPAATGTFAGDRASVIEQLGNALYCCIVATYAQGFALLTKASQVHGYELDLAEIARIWRGGCIIRAALLSEFRSAYRSQPDLPSLLLAPRLAGEMSRRTADWRTIVKLMVEQGLPAAALMNSLAYFDAYRTARLPTNLTQAQRDLFGAHTYERIDAAGTFHTEWEE
jgi:6-phosphogluconate dehydrogenase